MSTEQHDVPLTAWDAVGPEEVRPDVKVAGGPAPEPVELTGGYGPVAMQAGGASKVFTVACVSLLALVVGVSIYTVTTDDSSEGADKSSAATLLQPSSPAEAVTPTPTGEANAPTGDVKLSAAQARKAIRDRASRAARGDKTPRLLPKAAPTATPSPSPVGGAADSPDEGAGPPVAPGTAQAIAKGMMKSEGWNPAKEFGCLYNLWMRESGWRTTAGSLTGPYGIPQANPGTKMASAGPKWKTDAATQIKWGFGYIKSRYKTPCGGWAKFQASGWY
jgi:hypothetical protein